MKINVNLTIDIPDTTEWLDTYGTAPDARAIRQHVKNHVQYVVSEAAPFGTREVEATVTLKD